jgi:ribA/ribD-fused uncharacterized protein
MPLAFLAGGGAEPHPRKGAHKVNQRIDSFEGPHEFLSNFHHSPIRYNGSDFATAEHAFQASKAKNATHREQIRTAKTPGEAKRLGKKADLRPDWDSIKIRVMTEVLRKKFAPGTQLAQDLSATGEAELIEGNTWNDRFWGVCKGTGQNHLGKILMQIRAELKSNQ